jgi:hypothetical protein
LADALHSHVCYVALEIPGGIGGRRGLRVCGHSREQAMKTSKCLAGTTTAIVAATRYFPLSGEEKKRRTLDHPAGDRSRHSQSSASWTRTIVAVNTARIQRPMAIEPAATKINAAARSEVAGMPGMMQARVR